MPTEEILKQRFKADCDDCSERFEWRDTRAEARTDASNHQAENKLHVVSILRKTTSQAKTRFRAAK
jgi:hypothetical protein